MARGRENESEERAPRLSKCQKRGAGGGGPPGGPGFNNVLVLISITMLSGSTQVFLTRGSGVKSLHLPAKGTFSQALLTITQLFAL
ncbi:hypothetical protein NQZ68_015001 [Dissostichus eleginoides]|nr:hypothetical protein NQZ68_015001 [Dissostichus eleginoides]